LKLKFKNHETILFLKLAICIMTLQITSAQEAIIVKTSGHGKPIIWLPGFATSSEVWRETLENIEGNHENHLIDYAVFISHHIQKELKELEFLKSLIKS